ncbi:CapA family protein [Bacillus thermotolerans]|uniref:Poly-gamma-glutamate biosynthesis (Capsule formation) n=1 Tax=Bacillus thermotolerans TaxID=1221996 RepID=A0A0F5I0R5_BACTR|nr:CapA family protein [Bacillus thermotolerans]KKB39096.1 poly-gamma-glutamate biosynthesis (capsule formation) [Bacillus thermotolerans]
MKIRLKHTGQRRRRRRLKKPVRLTLLFLCIFVAGLSIYNITLEPAEEVQGNGLEEEAVQAKETAEAEKAAEPVETQITISAAGDFTLGTDETFQYADSFVDEAEKNGLSYFVEELDGVFKEDDFTTVNLETTLTDATEKAVKKFRFKGDPSYAQILELGGIEAVNLANNHIYDYLQEGYDDTIDTLKQADIGYFGYDNKYIAEVKGIKIGSLGYEGWDDTEAIRSQVSADIQELKEQGAEIVLVHYHWGVERSYVPEESQRTLAQYTIDSGADLILGHHPHVVQGIEEYNGKFIVYSLGNFMFGGNRNPSDKDTFVFQQTFHLTDGKLTDKKEINVVPFSISSVSHRNNYQPDKLEGAEAERVKNKIIDASNQIEGSDWLEYETVQ